MLLFGGAVLILQSPEMIIVLLLLIVGGTVTYFWSDYFPLVLFLFLAFSVEVQVTGNTRLTLPTEVLIVLLFGLFFVSILREGKIAYRSSPLNISIFLFYLVIVISLLYSQSFISTVKAIIRDTGYIIAGYYLIPKYITSDRRLKHVVFGCLIVHSLLVLYGFYTQVVGGIRIYDDIANPFFIEHCIYAAFLTISFSFLLAYFLDYEDTPYRFWLGVATAVFGLAILLTFVRAAWISIVLLLIFYLFQFRMRKSAVELILGLLLSLLIGIILLITTDLGRLFLQRFDTLMDFQYVANYDRLDRWFAAWHMWLDHMLFGVGWGAYPDIYYDYIVLGGAYSTHIRMGAHNLYLEIMAETGIIGITVFLLMIQQFFRQCYLLQKRITDRFQRVFLIAMQGAMITYLFHALLNNLGPSDKISLTFWFLLGMVPALQYLAERSEEQSKNEQKNTPHSPTG